MKALLAIAGCVFAVCLAMVVANLTIQTLIYIWEGVVIAFVILSFMLIWMFGFCHGIDPGHDAICRKWIRVLHLVTAILIWAAVAELVLRSAHGLWALLVLLLWHAWIEWAYKKVSK